MQLGKTNQLTAHRATDNGCYLIDTQGEEVLLPNKYVPSTLNIGDPISVFVYLDSEERPVATNLVPYVQLGEFAYLTCKQVTDYGAFLDWGLVKDLFVPFAEQRVKMQVGESYLIYLALDAKTNRLYASSKEQKFVKNKSIDLSEGEAVSILPYVETDLGIKVIINNLYDGLVYHSDIRKPFPLGVKTQGYLKLIREDFKIDVVLQPMGYKKSIDKNAQTILNALQKADSFLELTDKSDASLVQKVLGLSKKSFKKGVGFLYKNRLILLEKKGIRLI